MTEIVSGQVANGGTAVIGNDITVDLGGTAVGAVVSNGAYIYDFGTTSGTNVLFGGQEVVSSGIASNTVIGPQAVENVSAGGLTISTHVQGGGIAFLKPGGISQNTTVEAHGNQTVFQGAVASGTVVSSGGLLQVQGPQAGALPAGRVVSALILSGATMALQQADSLATVVNGGTEYITPNSVAIGTVISGGGQELIYAGGITSAPTIGATGTIHVSNGGTIAGPVTFAGAGATLIEDAAPPSSLVFSGFVTGDTIDLAGVVFNSANTISPQAGNVLSLAVAGGSAVDLQFAAGGLSGLAFNLVADGGSGTSIVANAACFAGGTRILTTRGEIPVEHLRVGDEVVTRLGPASAPIRWIGYRTLDCGRHPRPWDVMPVCVRAHAVARGQPHRDLLLSPDHALLLDGALVPVRYLINGATIVQLPVPRVTYFHIELPRHNAVLAEGLPAESFLDTGNRAAFANGGPVAQMAPEFARQTWQAQGCAPLVCDGPGLTALRRLLRSRAALLGHVLTKDAKLQVIVDGAPVVPQRVGERWRLALPARARELRLVSRRMTPAYTVEGSEDHRQLGVAISGIWLDGRTVPLEDPRLTEGWHQVEPDDGAAPWRWTNGDAALQCGNARVFEIGIRMTLDYWVTRRETVARTA